MSRPVAAKSKRPYLLRALFDWIVDSGLTPYILVSAENPDVRVPEQHVRDGKIVLNISPNAVRDLTLADELVSFDGRFSGTPFWVEVPIAQVAAIYAKETGEGMMFEPDSEDQGRDSDAQTKPEVSPKTGAQGDSSHLKVIK